MPNQIYRRSLSAVQRAKAQLEYRGYIFTATACYWAKQAIELLETKVETFSTSRAREQADQVAQQERECVAENGHWFTPEERVQVEVLACLIVPSDDTSPGAEHLDILGLSAVERLDCLVAGSPDRQILYARGLLALDQLARAWCSSKFVDLPAERQVELLESIDRLKQEWSKPTSLMGKIIRKLCMLYYRWSGLFSAVNLFPRLVQDVFQMFYTDQVSWIWLGYDGAPMPHGYPGLRKRPFPGQNPDAEN